MATTHFGWNTPFSFADTRPGALAADIERHGRVTQPGPDGKRQGNDGTASVTQAVCFDHALGLLEAGEWSDAFVALRDLADHGHPPAARMALMLSQRGTAVFGGHFPASRQAQDRWQHFSA
jgi:hypothetical protein